jgi:molybdate transport system ATP-binding protein
VTGDLLKFQCRFSHAQAFSLDAVFTLPHGISAIYGPSGSGKSTCLALIAGLLRPQAGTITLGPRTLVDCTQGRWVAPHRRQLALVFQENMLFPHRTVLANLRYGQCPSHPAAIPLAEVIQALELGDLLHRYPQHLSGGQQRRVALGRALLRSPQLLMMDEPLTGLDPALQQRTLDFLHSAHSRWAVPMLLVSHDQLAVRRLAEHVVVLEAGRVVAQGPAGATLDRATTQSMQGRPGPMNLLRIEQVRYQGDHAEGLLSGQAFHLPPHVRGTRVYVRCFPRDVAVALQDVPHISMRNHLRGIVRQIVPSGDNGRAFIAVDAGQLIWAELTISACRELNLQIGMPVVCLIKATATDQVG